MARRTTGAPRLSHIQAHHLTDGAPVCGLRPRARPPGPSTGKETEIMSHNGTELHRHGDSEDRSNGDIHGTDGTDELPPLATKVSSLQEAVDIAVREEVPDKSQFILARALKAFEFTTGYKLKPGERDSALGLWWGRMQPHLPPDADFDECRLDFEALFTQIRSPL